MCETAEDRRTTPRWARPFVVACVLASAGWFVDCFAHLVRDEPLGWRSVGAWDMFTVPAKRQGTVELLGSFDGEWRSVDVAALFPTQFDSGPRYVRRSFREDPRRLRVLADSACDRHPEKPQRIRVSDVSFALTLGETEQRSIRRTVRLDWDCARTAPRPGGVVW